MGGFKIAQRFITRNVLGLLIAIWLGNKLDGIFQTSPWALLILIIYVIVGSLALLVKEISSGK